MGSTEWEFLKAEFGPKPCGLQGSGCLAIDSELNALRDSTTFGSEATGLGNGLQCKQGLCLCVCVFVCGAFGDDLGGNEPTNLVSKPRLRAGTDD